MQRWSTLEWVWKNKTQKNPVTQTKDSEESVSINDSAYKSDEPQKTRKPMSMDYLFDNFGDINGKLTFSKNLVGS